MPPALASCTMLPRSDMSCSSIASFSVTYCDVHCVLRRRWIRNYVEVNPTMNIIGMIATRIPIVIPVHIFLLVNPKKWWLYPYDIPIEYPVHLAEFCWIVIIHWKIATIKPFGNDSPNPILIIPVKATWVMIKFIQGILYTPGTDVKWPPHGRLLGSLIFGFTTWVTWVSYLSNKWLVYNREMLIFLIGEYGIVEVPKKCRQVLPGFFSIDSVFSISSKYFRLAKGCDTWRPKFKTPPKKKQFMIVTDSFSGIKHIKHAQKTCFWHPISLSWWVE